MGIGVLVLGGSGTGKSSSLRNFTKNELGIVNVVGKPLPFKNDFNIINTDNYEKIADVLLKAKSKVIVIDDSQYLMANEFMRKATERGFDKFTDIAKNFWSLIDLVQRRLPSDTIVYFLHHTEFDNVGNEKVKTIGKMLDEKITIEGLFSIVLKTVVDNGNYYFSTQNNGHDTVKSPMGMFDNEKIGNDLKAVDTAIRDYYGLGLVDEKKGDKNNA